MQFGQSDTRALQRSDTEVAGQRELEPASQAVTEECRDPGFVHVLDRRQHPQPLVENHVDPSGIAYYTGEFLEVHADREVSVPGCGDDDGPNRRVGGNGGDERLERVHERKGDAVVRSVIDGDDRDRAAALVREAAVTHSDFGKPMTSPRLIDTQSRASR